MIRPLLLLVGGALCACAAAVEDTPVAEPEQAAPVIATLRLRDHDLSIASTAVGVRYDLKDSSGTRWHLTFDELAALAPELAEVVRSATAHSESAPAERRIDARLHRSVGEQSERDIGWAGRAH